MAPTPNSRTRLRSAAVASLVGITGFAGGLQLAAVIGSVLSLHELRLAEVVATAPLIWATYVVVGFLPLLLVCWMGASVRTEVAARWPGMGAPLFVAAGGAVGLVLIGGMVLGWPRTGPLDWLPVSLATFSGAGAAALLWRWSA